MSHIVRMSVASDTGIPDLNSVLGEFPQCDDHPGKDIPAKSLTESFDLVNTDVNQSGEDGGSMKVYLRVRPMDNNDCKSESTIRVLSSTSISTSAPESSKRSAYSKIDERHYTFSQVLGPEASQLNLYETVAEPLVDRFVGGLGCLLFAYGMTNAGKTHSIQGSKEHPGLFPRLLRTALSHGQRSHRSVSLSMLEIYQDKVFDLLSFRRENLHIRDNGGSVEVGKLSQHAVSSQDDVQSLLEAASIRRSKAHTSLNAGSSRSHAIYCISMSSSNASATTMNGDEDKSATHFYIIDLAGAERSSRTKATLSQQREANNINTSLMQLWRCLNAIKRRGTDTSASVPFRDNKLTHLLMPHLAKAGLNGVAMLTCVNPQIDDYDETISVLGNASLACQIKELADMRATRSSALANERAIERAARENDRAARENERAARENDRQGQKRRLESTGTAQPSKYPRDILRPVKTSTDTLTTVSIAPPKVPIAPPMVPIAPPMVPIAPPIVPIAPPKAPVVPRQSAVVASAEDLSQLLLALQQEVAELKAENERLVTEGGFKESLIRAEVAVELEQRSHDLLQQMAAMQTQIDEAARGDRGANDVTKSCRKARRNQRFLASAGATRDIMDAEEEMERIKWKHESELTSLRGEIRSKEQEAQSWKHKFEVASHEIEKLRLAPSSQAQRSGAEQELSQRMQRDHRFKDIPLPLKQKSPKRSPLGDKTNSPIRLVDLSAAKANNSPKNSFEIYNDENSRSRVFSPYMQRLRSNFSKT